MTRAGLIELAVALAFGALMTAIDYHAGPEPVFGAFSAFALLLGMVVSMSMQENPVMIGTIVLFWAALGWIALRLVRVIVANARSSQA